MDKRNETSVLIVDDDFLLVEYLRDVVTDLGHRVCGDAGTADEAIALARELEPNLILMDVRLRGVRDGVDAARDIMSERSVPIIFITGSTEPETLARIRGSSPSSVLIKPILPDQLAAAIGAV